MATAIRPLRRLHVGLESTPGTLVAATRQLIGSGRLNEEAEFYRSTYPSGLRATPGGAGVVTRRGTTLSWETELTAEEILWPLLTGIRGGVTPTDDDGLKIWTFSPELATGIPTIDTATLEFLDSDGVSNHYYGEAGYAFTRSFGISWTVNQIATLTWEMAARARQSDTPTAGLTPYSGRVPLVSNLLSVTIDSDWSSLGTTAVEGVMRSATFSCTTGLDANYTMDGRSDADMVRHQVNLLSGTLELVMELNASTATYFQSFRDNDLLFVRLAQTGPSNRLVQIDGCYRFSASPSFSEDNEQVLMTANLEAVIDPTTNNIFQFTVQNALATA